RNAVELVGAHDHVTGKCTIDAVPHAAPIRAEDEITGAAVLAIAAGYRRGAQTGRSLPRFHIGDVATYFNHGACELVAEDDRGKVAEGVVHDMDVGAANTAICNFQLYL